MVDVSFEQRLSSDARINEHALNEEIVKQPSLYAYYASVYSQQMRKAAQAKTNLGILEGEIHREYKELEASGTKLTDKDKEKMLKSDCRWVETRNFLDDAEAQEELYRNLLEAFRQKSSMLCQLGLRQREEIRSNISISNPTDLGNDILKKMK